MGLRYFVLLSIAALCLVSCGNRKPESVKPEIKGITESVYASVIVRPAISYMSQTTRSGVVKKIYVLEGDSVKIGTKLFDVVPASKDINQFENSKIDLKQATSKYLGENNFLKSLELEIRKIKENLFLDSINYSRQLHLNEKDIGTQSDLEQSKLKYESSLIQLNILDEKYAHQKEELENNYFKALNQKKMEQSKLRDFSVTSNIEGMVYSIEYKEGDFVTSQQKFGEIGSSNFFKLEMDIDETDITKLEVNDSIFVTLNAYPDQIFIASVYKIYPKKNDLTKTFKVEGLFVDLPNKVFNGLSGEANILVARREKALVIPAEYLINKNTVLTKNGEQGVKLGAKSLQFVEVVSGIDSNTIIFKPGTD